MAAHAAECRSAAPAAVHVATREASTAVEVAQSGTPVSLSRYASRRASSASSTRSGRELGTSTSTATELRTDAAARARLVQERQREAKWVTMLASYESWRGSRKLIARCRKGIPSAIRGIAWPKLLNVEAVEKELPTLYETSLAAPDAASDRAIKLDIGRTFPCVSMFAKADSTGQKALHRVLSAYAACDSEVGYCQGMGFVAAVLLSFVPERQAFYMFWTMMQRPPLMMRRLFMRDLKALGTLLGVLQLLLAQKRPKLAEHLRAQGVEPAMVYTQWVMTAFSYAVPFEVTVRAWDCMLAEGFKPVIRIALAAMMRAEPELKAREFEGIMAVVRGLSEVTFEEPDATSAPIVVASQTSPAAAAASSASDAAATAAPSRREIEEARLAAVCAHVLDPDGLIKDAYVIPLRRREIIAAAATASTDEVPDLPG